MSYRILLISPYGNIPVYWIPLALGYLKSNTPVQHHVEILDCTLKEMPSNSPRLVSKLEKYKPDIVGVSTASLTSTEAINVLKVAKSVNHKIVTLIGGSHATNYSEKVMDNDFIDYCFRGESDLAFPVFLEQLPEKTFTFVDGLINKAKEQNFNILL